MKQIWIMKEARGGKKIPKVSKSFEKSSIAIEL